MSVTGRLFVHSGLLAFAAAAVAAPPGAPAQELVATAPVIDTIIINRSDVFPDSIAATSGIFRAMNSLHVVTHERVIRRYLLFKQGQPFDSALVSQTERILRDLQIFSELHLDTTTIDGKFAVTVNTRDGWSTKPKIKFAVASDGTVTATLGVLEINLLGTGVLAQAYWTKEVNRNGADLAVQWNRIVGRLTSGFKAQLMSDGSNGSWEAGAPFFSSMDPRGAMYNGFAADRRVLQFVSTNERGTDTIEWQQDALINDVIGAIATDERPTGYVRFGALGQLRQETFSLRSDSATNVPDTLSGYFGGLFEVRDDRFHRVRMFNGFGTEDVDVSRTLSITLNVAPEAFGYPSTGVGLAMIASGAIPLGFGEESFLHAQLTGNGLFGSQWYNASGLDSGRVVLQVTAGVKSHPRHATILHLEAGMQENPKPGTQFELGFTTPPRMFPAYSFVGTREFWGMFEHRWYTFDHVLNLVGIGFAGFLDFGGAWYPESEDAVFGQPARWGGNIGIGVRIGSVLSTIPNTGRLDVGYQFGDGVSGNGWAISFGSGFVFPKRVILRTDRQPLISATGTQ